MNSGVKTSSDAPSDVTVFKPSLMLRINGWFGLVFGIVLSAAALEDRLHKIAEAIGCEFRPPGPGDCPFFS